MVIQSISISESMLTFFNPVNLNVTFKAEANASAYQIQLYLIHPNQYGMEEPTPYTYVQWSNENSNLTHKAYTIRSGSTYTISTTLYPNVRSTPEAELDKIRDKGRDPFTLFTRLAINVITYDGTGVYALPVDNKRKETPNVNTFPKRIDPTINSITVSDASGRGHYDRYGAWLTNVTPIDISVDCNVNRLYGSDSSSSALIIDGTEYKINSLMNDAFRVVFDKAGTFTAKFRIKDYFGVTVERDLDPFVVVAYSPPTVNSFSAERIAEDADHNWEPDDDGGYIWNNLDVSVSEYPQGNPWTAKLWVKDESENLGVVLYESDGTGDGHFIRDHYVGEDGYMQRFSVDKNESYYVALEIIDWVGYSSGRIESSTAITAVGALFDIEENGVAVGMIVDGELPNDVDEKKFQCAYPAYFYNGVDPIVNNETLTFGSGVFFNGYVSAGRTELFVCVPIKKSLANVKWVECTNLLANIANSGGYCKTSSYKENGTQYASIVSTITVSKETNELYIKMVNPSAMTVNNNDNVQCRLLSMTLVFHTTERGD